MLETPVTFPKRGYKPVVPTESLKALWPSNRQRLSSASLRVPQAPLPGP